MFRDTESTGGSTRPTIKESTEITLLSREKELALINRWQKDADPKAMTELIKAYDPLIKKVASRAHRRYPFMSRDDCIQTCCVAFVQAIQNYNSSYDNTLATYLYSFMPSSLDRQASRETTYRPPSGLTSRLIGLHLANELRKHPEYHTPLLEIFEAVGKKTNRPAAQIENHYTKAFKTAVSFDKKIGNDGESSQTFGDRIEDPSSIDPVEKIDRERISTMLEEALNSLPERDQMILRERFGFNADEPTLLGTLGDTLGISGERVRQIEEKALKKLLAYFEDKQLKAEIIEFLMP